MSRFHLKLNLNPRWCCEEAQSTHMLIWRDIKGSLCRNKPTTSLGSLRHCWKSVTTTTWIRPRQNVTRSNALWAEPQFRSPVANWQHPFWFQVSHSASSGTSSVVWPDPGPADLWPLPRLMQHLMLMHHSVGFKLLSVSHFGIPKATCGGDSSRIPLPALQPHQS